MAPEPITTLREFGNTWLAKAVTPPKVTDNEVILRSVPVIVTMVPIPPVVG